MGFLQKLRDFEPAFYIVIALVGLLFVRQFMLAWDELRGAAFGLERERAQDKLNLAAGVLVALLSITVVVFVLVSFVAPAATEAIPTPTLNLLATATATLPPGVPTYTPAPGAELTRAAVQASAPAPAGGCIAGQVEITVPKAGEEVMGIVPVLGSATIANFGFYKFEIKRPNETVWLTIQAGNAPKTNDKLGEWDTTRLTPGEYQLGLVVVDNQAQALAPCVIQIRVARAPEPTPAP